jgi:protein tyrosine phosphatase
LTGPGNSFVPHVQVENKKKNRYPDKLPYDHNRVLLNALINGSNSDYINASTVVCSL